ncbi:triacylglycerol lipase [Microbacterium sp. Marseille-Q6965]|uniref:esterase/lipase family protein n=1 Tax=Microbacterium sp. Marseille-Q6965 TaxID=2965072 RepID=UPI0021B80EAD|nr:alpha/beta hydrolase [Microbacterium sp. Marseille-Q6965]
MPTAPVNAIRALDWWLRDYAYAAFWQARSFGNRTDPEQFRTGEQTPILVIPGVYETWKFLQPLIVALHERGHPVHVVEPLRHNRRPVATGAALVAEHLEAHDLRDVVLVAHSKGGLIGKHVMALAPAAARVRGMVAVATPFGGSRYAQLMLSPTLRSFSPRNATILALARETAVNARIVSLYGRFDPHIPGGSELSGARNVVLETGGHFRILAHPRVIAEVAAMAEPAVR